MRTCGLVTDLRAVGPQEHLCWASEDAPSYRSRARRFLSAGIDAAQRVILVTSEHGLPVEPPYPPKPLAAALAGSPNRCDWRIYGWR